MMNLIRPDAGRIQLFGLDHRAHEKEIKERIGFVYADNHFYDELTVDQIKRITASLYRRWDEQAFQGYLRRFSLPAHKKIKHLSRGMKMKLSIALALSHHAELIIMDEPTSGLDPVVRHEILELMAELIQDGEKTIFFPTHITSDLEQNRRLHHLHPRRPPALQPDPGGNTGALPDGQGRDGAFGCG